MFQFKTDVAKRYLTGENSYKIAKDEGCCTMTILKELKRKKIKIRASGGQNRFQFQTDIVKRYLNKENANEIAESEGCSGKAVRDNLVRMGIKLRSRKEAKALTRIKFKTDIAKRYLDGESTYKIAEDEGCHNVTIQMRLIEKGIKMRSGMGGQFEKWTRQDNEKLKELWLDFTLSKKDISKRLNRTSGAVWCRARRFGWLKSYSRPRDKSEPKKAICKICNSKYTYIHIANCNYCPKCKAEADRVRGLQGNKKYRLKNKEKERTRKQIWYQKNKAKVSVHQKEYRRENREKINRQKQEYRKQKK